MKKSPLLLALGAVFVIGLAPAALGATAKIPGKVVFDSSGELQNPPSPDRDVYVFGHVKSPKAACLANRKVVIVARYLGEGSFLPFDVARTGVGGGFNAIGAGTHNANTIDRARFVLKPKTIGPKNHPKTCDGDTETAG